MKNDMTISSDKIHDLMTKKELSFIESIFSQAEEVVTKGGKVIIQQESVNAAPEPQLVLRTIEEINKWQDEVRQVIGKASNHSSQ